MADSPVDQQDPFAPAARTPRPANRAGDDIAAQSGCGRGTREGRLDYLDSLRGIAVFAVFIVHATEVFSRLTERDPGIKQFGDDLNLGRVGVVTFFAISGFLIPASLSGTTKTGLRQFAIRRLFRLYPAYLVSLIPSAATYTMMSRGDPVTLHQLLLNLTMLPRLFGVPMLNGAYWTLEVELAFYVMCSLLFYGAVLQNSFVLASLMFGMFCVFYSSQGVIWGGMFNPQLTGDTFFFWLNLSCMFWGAVIRRWRDSGTLDALSRIMLALVTLYWFCWMPGAYALNVGGLLQLSLDSRLIAGYSIGLLIFALGVFAIRIRTKPLVWFGRISYSFYLTHQGGLFLLFWLGQRFPVLQHGPMLGYLVAGLACSTALAAVCYYLVERPSMRLGHRLAMRW